MKNTNIKICCKRFKEEAKLKALAGGGFMYPPAMIPNAQIEYDEDKNVWNINGCCGGGCYVVTGVKFCPFCGTKIIK
jgi:hypothetical protein